MTGLRWLQDNSEPILSLVAGCYTLTRELYVPVIRRECKILTMGRTKGTKNRVGHKAGGSRLAY